MIDFFKKNSRMITKSLLNQFGAAVLALTITIPASSKNWLLAFISCFSIAFYLILLYTSMWEEGGKEKIRIDGGRAEYSPWRGFFISLCANIPNILLGVLIVIGSIFGSSGSAFGFGWAAAVNSGARFIAMLWESMYLGLITLYSPNNPIGFILIILPALLVSTLGYMAGLKGIKIIKKRNGKSQ